MSKLIESVRQLIARVIGQQPSPETQKVELVKGMMKMLALTEEKELGCDEVLEVVDRYAEAIVQGENVSELMPLVHHHMKMCRECREELEMLLEMIQVETA